MLFELLRIQQVILKLLFLEFLEFNLIILLFLI